MNSVKFPSDIFLSEDLSDVRVMVENKMTKSDFPAHSLVLKRASPVFRTMLESEFAEGQSKTITITDFKANHIKQFFKFLYTDTLPDTFASLCELTKLAHKYMVQSLMERCEEALLEFVNLQNIYELCNLAELHSLAKLRGHCLSFIKRAAFKLLQCDELESLSGDLIKDIVSADDLNMCSEMGVFWAIWKWGSMNVTSVSGVINNENIREFIKDLLKHVRWSLTSKNDRDKIESLGITVDDLDLQKQDSLREPSTTDSPWFLNQCNILNLDDFSSSCTFLENAYKTSEKRCFLRLVSLADAPFYLVGVLFACADDPIGGRLICRCESSSSVAEIDTTYSRCLEIESVCYEEVMCEFSKPVKICKNQALTITVLHDHAFGSVQLKFDGNIIWGDKGRTLIVDGVVYGIRQLFVL